MVDTFLDPDLPVAWFGWDDRTSNGFCGPCNLEAHLGFAALAIRATGDFAAVLKQAGQTSMAANYTATAARLAKQLRARPSTTGRGSEWYDDYGVHAASYLINAKIVASAKTMNFVVKKRNVVSNHTETRNCVSKTRNFVFKMMNSAAPAEEQ